MKKTRNNIRKLSIQFWIGSFFDVIEKLIYKMKMSNNK